MTERSTPAPTTAGALADLPLPETMLTYASILEKRRYYTDPITGKKYPLATGEIVEAACAALRHCARNSAPQETRGDEPVNADEVVTRLYRRFKDWSERGFGPDDVTWCEVKADINEMIALAASRQSPRLEREGEPVVSLKPMGLSDNRIDYFVSIKVGDREVTPHVFRDEYKAAYHVALYDWLLNGSGEEPDIVAFGPHDWPARVLAASQRSPRLEREALAAALYAVEYDPEAYLFSKAVDAEREIFLKFADVAILALLSPAPSPAPLPD